MMVFLETIQHAGYSASKETYLPKSNPDSTRTSPAGSTFVSFNHQPLDHGVRHFASRTKARIKRHIYFLEPKAFKIDFDYFFKEEVKEYSFFFELL